jgi:hypothetical protein
MRLINTSTGLFEEFIGDQIPQYVILSHTWEGEEVTFEDVKSNPSYRQKKGYRKIEMTCRLASEANFRYAWVDACCIDKSSSAELTEAINSMYQWYQTSEICYVFLSDLPTAAPLETALGSCRWFTRGWTLQELIAPRQLAFFDEDWQYRGAKADLADQLSMITGVDEDILTESAHLSEKPVAQKMSWSADRKTTRVEDLAYCLLGIFDVNMPLLYGERQKSFRRLQEEIIKSTADYSIFAWMWPVGTRRPEQRNGRFYCGVLAESPLYFGQSRSFIKRTVNEWRDFSISNNGVKIQSQILSQPIPNKGGYQYVLPLHGSPDSGFCLGVRLRKYGPEQFVREDPWQLLQYKGPLWPNTAKATYLLIDPPGILSHPSSFITDMSSFITSRRSHALQVEFPQGTEASEFGPSSRFDNEDHAFFLVGDDAWDTAIIQFDVSVSHVIGSRTKVFKSELVFYALGWSSSHFHDLQCTLVNYAPPLAGTIDLVQRRISDWEHNRFQILGLLQYRRFPRGPETCLSLLEQTP